MRRLTLAAAVLALAVPLLPAGAAWAAPLPVSACGKVITKPGSYALTKSLTCPGTAITVAATGVKLALKGYTLTGPGDDAGAVGVAVGDSDHSYRGVFVSGPGRITGFGTGIWTVGLDHSRIDGLVLVENRFGLIVSSGDGGLSTGNTFSNLVVNENESHGVTFNGVTRSFFLKNEVAANGGDGLLLYWATKNIVKRNDFQDNRHGIYAEGIPFTSNNIIADNDAFDSAEYDFFDENALPVNHWYKNLFETANRDYID